MAKPQGRERAESVLRMKQALTRGLSFNAFYRSAQEKGISYRRIDMMSEWRSQGELKKKEGLLKYVRKDYMPSAELVKAESWKMSKEYMYKVKVETRLRPGIKPVEQFVNVISDNPLTVRGVEQRAVELWRVWYPTKVDEITKMVVETGIRRVQ